jgi:hypothetical protein
MHWRPSQGFGSQVSRDIGTVSGKRDKSRVQHGRLQTIMLKIGSHVALLFLPVSREISDDRLWRPMLWRPR